MKRKMIYLALVLSFISFTLYIGNSTLTYNVQKENNKVQEDNSILKEDNDIKANTDIVDTKDVYPEIHTIKSYLCDDDWSEFKGGCSWYCVAKVPTLSTSSELKPYKEITYKAQNAHDFNLDTVWCEGAEGYGIGETLTLKESTDLNSLSITHFEIINGYVKSEQLWKDNSRVKQFDVSLNGEFFKTLHLEDSMEVQCFDIGLIPFSLYDEIVFEFKIASVYPGEKYQDTAITELELDGLGGH